MMVSGDGITKSAVNELEVSERDYEHRNRALKNLEKMKLIESTWVKISSGIYTNGCIIAYYKPVKKSKRR